MPRRRSHRPGAEWLPQADSGLAASRPKITGDSHHGNAAPLARIAPIHTTASSECTPWRRSASPQPVAASSRGGDFQSSFQPVSAASTNWLWNSMRTGASSNECSNSIAAPSQSRSTPPNCRACPRLPAQRDDQHREQLGREQQHRGHAEQRQHQLQVRGRPDREQLIRLDEVLRHVVRLAREQQRRDEQERQPQRRRRICQHAGQEHRAVHRVQIGLEHQARVLQVDMTPAPVTLDLGEQVRRQLLVTAVEVVGDQTFQPARRISAASTKSCDITLPDSEVRPGSGASAQCAMNGATRRIALWPQ